MGSNRGPLEREPSTLPLEESAKIIQQNAFKKLFKNIPLQLQLHITSFFYQYTLVLVYI